MSANTRLDSLSDLVYNKANLLVICSCGRRHIFDAARANRYALLRRWNTQLETLAGHLLCGACGRRPAKLRATPEPPTPDDPWPRDELGWKRLHKRLRD